MQAASLIHSDGMQQSGACDEPVMWLQMMWTRRTGGPRSAGAWRRLRQAALMSTWSPW